MSMAVYNNYSTTIVIMDYTMYEQYHAHDCFKLKLAVYLLYMQCMTLHVHAYMQDCFEWIDPLFIIVAMYM